MCEGRNLLQDPFVLCTHQQWLCNKILVFRAMFDIIFKFLHLHLRDDPYQIQIMSYQKIYMRACYRHIIEKSPTVSNK